MGEGGKLIRIVSKLPRTYVVPHHKTITLTWLGLPAFPYNLVALLMSTRARKWLPGPGSQVVAGTQNGPERAPTWPSMVLGLPTAHIHYGHLLSIMNDVPMDYLQLWGAGIWAFYGSS